MENTYLTLFVCYILYAYNRKCVAFSMPSIMEDGLDTSQAGLILSSQSIALCGSKLFFGMLSDRVNPLYLFASGLFFSGLVTLLFSSSTTVSAFCFFSFLNGVAQGCGWPSLSKILRQRADPARFGTMWSFLSSSNNISGCLSPFIISYLAVTYGWRYSLYAGGLASITLSFVPLLMTPFSSERNQSYTYSPTTPSTKSKSYDSKMTLKDLLLKDSFLWLVVMCEMAVFCVRSTLLDWGQLYLKQDCGLSFVHGSVFASSLEIGGLIGRLFAGYLSDIYVRRALSKQESHLPSFQLRMYVAVCFLLGSFISLHMYRVSLSPSSSLMCISCLGLLLGAFLYGVIVICGIVSSELAPSHLSGSSSAIVALGGNIGATISGLPISSLAALYSWSQVLLILEIGIGLTLLSVIGFKYLRSQSSIIKKNE